MQIHNQLPKPNQKGFTLLEVIIVIIIIGVLASLALPRFFSTIEYARGVEGMLSLASVRQSVERCYMMRRDYTNCNFPLLDMEDPATSPGAHFTYSILGEVNGYTITAIRNTRDGGTGGTISVIFDGTNISRTGTGPFGAIQ